MTRDSAPEGSRVAFMETQPGVNESSPGFSKFAQEEKVWKLLDLMQSVADEAGRCNPERETGQRQSTQAPKFTFKAPLHYV